jgi:hypothetical protein
VTTAFDATYPESYGIDFGISDPGAKSSPSALFSHFAYSPLPDTHLSNQAAIATATAQLAKASQGPYTTPVPGFDCDKGGGQWKPTSEAEDYVTTRCLANGLAVSQGSTAKYDGRVPFYWLNGNFPLNYKVKVQIDVSGLNGGCAGIGTRSENYGFYVCSNGYWVIDGYDNKGQGKQLAQGQIDQLSSYTMEVTSNGSTQSLTLNGSQVASVNSPSEATDHIVLSMFLPQGSTGGSAVFSNFVFTPLFGII